MSKSKVHKHNWKYYDGWLGYESLKCTICNVDINDISDKE